VTDTDAGIAQIAAQFGQLAGQAPGGPGAAVKVQAGLQAGIGDGAAAAVMGQARPLPLAPRIVPVVAAATVSAAGLAIVNLGSPNDGYFWAVQLIVVSDAGAWSASMGAATGQMCIGQAATDPAKALPPHYVRWPFATLPNAATFSRQGMYVSDNDQLFMQVLGGTPAEVVQATAVVEVWNSAEAAAAGYWS
jgi:hypothetical protein